MQQLTKRNFAFLFENYLKINIDFCVVIAAAAQAERVVIDKYCTVYA